MMIRSMIIRTFLAACSLAVTTTTANAQVDADISTAEKTLAVTRLIEQLADDSAALRNEAERKLVELGADAAAKVAQAAAGGDTETLYRAKRILIAIASSDNESTAIAAETAIRSLAKSDNAAAAKMAGELAKQFAPSQVVDAYRKAVAAAKELRGKGETNPEVVDQKWVDELIAKHGFRHVTGDNDIFDSDAPPPADWSVVRDPAAHQELLMYRVKWFKGGWSRWFIPGVNDDDSKVKGHRMWRYFSDHQWQRVEIPFKLGQYTSRRDFLGDVELPMQEEPTEQPPKETE